MRRAEFVETAQETLHEILDSIPVGHLALTDEQGLPVVKPMHFARIPGKVVFHGATSGERAGRVGSAACFVADRLLANLPSYWRHPEKACVAAAFYVSVMVKGTLRALEEPGEKARALEALMEKHQPEGGYTKLTAGQSSHAAMASVLVLGLDLAGATCKVKVGQNLRPELRRELYSKLLERDAPGDREAASWMLRADPGLAAVRALLPHQEGSLLVTDRPQDVPVEQLRELMDTTYWASGRSSDQVRRLLRGSLVAAVMEDGRLLGFARAITDGAARAWIYDVIVRPDSRGRGVGRRVMEALLADPGLTQVERISLTTRDAEPFYKLLGFRTISPLQTQHGTSMWMCRERPEAGPVAGADPADQHEFSPPLPSPGGGGVGGGQPERNARAGGPASLPVLARRQPGQPDGD